MVYTKLKKSGRECVPLIIKEGTINGDPVASVIASIWEETAFAEIVSEDSRVEAFQTKFNRDISWKMGNNIKVRTLWDKVFMFQGDLLLLRLAEQPTPSNMGAYILGFALLDSEAEYPMLYEPPRLGEYRRLHLTINYIFEQIREHYKGGR